jgi:hypothetical protein
MRWAIAAVLFIIAIFGFFVGYAVSSLVLNEFKDALDPHAAKLSGTEATDTMILIQSAFGIICSISFVLIVVVFVLDSLSEEPEYYYR